MLRIPAGALISACFFVFVFHAVSDTFPDPRAATAVLPHDLIDGEALARDNGCLRCHEWEGVALLDQGPYLNFAGDKLNPEWIDSFLVDPSGSGMPVIDLTAGERAVLTRFIAGQHGDTGFAATTPGDSARGARLYEINRCAQCHSPGRPFPRLENIERKVRRGWLAAFLLDPGTAQPRAQMPSYEFSRSDAGDLASYLVPKDRVSIPPADSGTGIDLFVEKRCITCHCVQECGGKPMADHMAHGRDLGIHRVGNDSIPRIVMSDAEESEMWRALRMWMSPVSDGSDSLASGGFDNYWELPVPFQGDVPNGWSGLEMSLNPAACGVCHPRQYFDWSGSLHARAYTPGFRAELTATRDNGCLNCHAPLLEQRDDYLLRQSGVGCAACHLRGHRRHGPPLWENDPVAANRRGRHGGILRDAFFTQSEFCARCHQFNAGDMMLSDKLIMNTYNEWQASPAADTGATCQSCHMPGRRHFWRGIHDSNMVRGALTMEIEDRTIQISTNAGHRTPTYLVPRIVVSAWSEDADGREIAASRTSWIIRRDVELEGSEYDHEISDTRLIPGTVRSYDYGFTSDAAESMVVSVAVEPDAYYHALYESRLENTDPGPELRSLYEEALARPPAPPYNVITRRVPLR